jgi:hypothetical protein
MGLILDTLFKVFILFIIPFVSHPIIVWECVPFETKRLLKIADYSLFESPNELFLCIVQPRNEPDMIRMITIVV